MMNYNYMMGGGGAGVMLFAWIIYVLVAALLMLGIAAMEIHKQKIESIKTKKLQSLFSKGGKVRAFLRI